MIARWLTINIITICIIILWSCYQGYESSYILIGKMIAQVAFILFLINVNMYFVFLLIRKSKIRHVKVKLAKISKQMMKYHIPIALTATISTIIHAGIMVYSHFDKFLMVKTISGFIAIMVLIVLLYSGLLRRWKASGIRRKFHFMMAFLFFAFVIFHVFV